MLEQLPPALLVDALQRPLDRVGLGAGEPVLHRHHVEHRRVGPLGLGQVLGTERVDPVAHRRRRAAALQPVEVGLGRAASEAERAAVDLDDLLALGREHLGDALLQIAFGSRSRNSEAAPRIAMLAARPDPAARAMRSASISTWRGWAAIRSSTDSTGG